MRRTSFRDWSCSVARTADLLGDWWTPLVLRELFLGSLRFDDIQRALSIGRNVLAERLKRLREEGLLERQKYQDRPARFEYRLTEKGRDFFPVILAMVRWGDRWLYEGEEPPLLLRHTRCGEISHGDLVCARCSEPLRHGEVRAELPDGTTADLAARVAAVEGVRQLRSRRAPSRSRAKATKKSRKPRP